MGWREWSQTQYDKWGSKLQGRYDDIKLWKLNDEQAVFLENTLKLIPAAFRSLLLGMVKKLYTATYKKEGIKGVLALIENIQRFLNVFADSIKK